MQFADRAGRPAERHGGGVKWLIDNNVPRGVTVLLAESGHEPIEVRQVLAHNSPDAAYAAAGCFVLVTHDRGLAKRCLLAGIHHLWLRTPEPHDEGRVRDVLPAIEEAFAQGSTRVVVSRSTLRYGPDTRDLSAGT
jgi:predicted nuclease of predicted toxin-antitoxin system